MPTYDPHYNPIQPDDEAFNRRMAEIEERRRARGTMPTTVVGPTGASPGKDMAGRPLVPPTQAPAQPADPSKPAKTGDAFGDFRAQQQAENRRRIAEGARTRANAAISQFEAQDAEEAKAKAALRQSQNDKAYTLWTALGGQNDRVLGMAANDFAHTFNEQMQGRGEILGTELKERDDGKGGKERYFIFTAKMPDGSTKPFTYGRKELQKKLMRHGYSELSFADEPVPEPETPAKPAMTPEQQEKLIGTVLERYKPEAAADILKGYGIENFNQDWLKPTPVEQAEKPDPAEVKRQEAWTAAYNEHFARILKDNSGLTPEQVKVEATKWANAQVGVSAASASAQPTDAPADIADTLEASDKKDQNKQQQSPNNKQNGAQEDVDKNGEENKQVEIGGRYSKSRSWDRGRWYDDDELAWDEKEGKRVPDRSKGWDIRNAKDSVKHVRFGEDGKVRFTIDETVDDGATRENGRGSAIFEDTNAPNINRRGSRTATEILKRLGLWTTEQVKNHRVKDPENWGIGKLDIELTREQYEEFMKHLNNFTMPKKKKPTSESK